MRIRPLATSVAVGIVLIAFVFLFKQFDWGTTNVQAARSIASAASSAEPKASAPIVVRSASIGPLSPWQLDRQPKLARVFVDVSGSMRGFSRSPSSPLANVARRMRWWLFSEGVTSFEGAGFGTSVDLLRPISGIEEALGWPTTRDDTCLGLPFDTARRPPTSNGPPALVIAITDGVASARGHACGKSCSAGNDIACVAASMRDYVLAGNGLWVVGFRTPFSGAYPPADGGHAVMVKSAQRPIYFLIGSPSLAVGRSLVKHLREWAAGAGVGIETLALEVWPGEWQGWSAPDFVLPTPSANEFRPTAVQRDLCQSTLAIDAIEAGTTPLRMTLRNISPKIERIFWAARLPPLAGSNSSWVNGPIPGIVLRARKEPIVDGGRVIRFMLEPAPSPASASASAPGSAPGSASGAAAGRLACLEFTRREAVSVRLAWDVVATLDANALAAWGTDDDTQLSAIDRTMNIGELWSLTAALVKRAAGDVETPLADVRLK